MIIDFFYLCNSILINLKLNQNVRRKKHWKTLEKEAKEKELDSQEKDSQIEEIEVNNEEFVETEQKEPSVPLSQVSDLVAQEVAKALANLPIQQPEKVVEVVKEVHVPIAVKDQNFDEIP